MYLKRTVYDKLLEWKNEQNRSTLEVNCARQVGKFISTFLNKAENSSWNATNRLHHGYPVQNVRSIPFMTHSVFLNLTLLILTIQ